MEMFIVFTVMWTILIILVTHLVTMVRFADPLRYELDEMKRVAELD